MSTRGEREEQSCGYFLNKVALRFFNRTPETFSPRSAAKTKFPRLRIDRTVRLHRYRSTRIFSLFRRLSRCLRIVGHRRTFPWLEVAMPSFLEKFPLMSPFLWELESGCQSLALLSFDPRAASWIQSNPYPTV